jgi:hypothetical protein
MIRNGAKGLNRAKWMFFLSLALLLAGCKDGDRDAMDMAVKYSLFTGYFDFLTQDPWF